MKKTLLASRIQTPDGTILHSKNTLDYVWHIDAISDEKYHLDGGTSYIKKSVNKHKAKNISVYNTDKIEKIREVFVWNTTGKSGLEAYYYVFLKDMSNTHIHAILDTQPLSVITQDVFKRELEYRTNKGLYIKEDNILHKNQFLLEKINKKGISINIEYGKKVIFTFKKSHIFTMICSDSSDFQNMLYSSAQELNYIIQYEKIKTNAKTGKITKIKDYGTKRYEK